ncbi:MAG: methyltransferase domain-containing protein [Alphaproteobacteria bacterium]|nr:methyltransferase domain-containing protein [Alphaproteobacteria bacterium]
MVAAPVMTADQQYYAYSHNLPLVPRVAHRARTSVFDYFMKVMQPVAADKVLDLGVSLENSSALSNMFERLYPHPAQMTCAGIEECPGFEAAFQGTRYVRIEPHARLPFADKAFDVGYSNAVLEHVGTREQQRDFLRELCRVSKRVFVVIPNRLFPVEHHTALPFVHYLPMPVMWRLLKGTKWDYWASMQNLHLMFPWQFAALMPEDHPFKMRAVGLGLGWLSSNLIAHSR